MENNVQISEKAVALRRRGFSYADIGKELKVSKTSVSNWVKNLKLSETEKINVQKNLKAKIVRRKLTASISVRARKIFKEKVAYEKAEKDFARFSKEPLFMLGLGLYWAHSSVKGANFQFMSRDAGIVKIMTEWIKKYLGQRREDTKYRLFVDLKSKNDGHERFWARTIGVSPESFQKTIFLRSKNDRNDREYKGSLSIVIGKVDVFRKVIAWQKLGMRYYG